MPNNDYPKLRECPFCGSRDVRIERKTHDAGMSGRIEMAFVQCQKCHATGAKADDWDDYYQTIVQKKTLEDFAIERWNKRADTTMSKEMQIAKIARDFNKDMCSDREHVESCAECVGASEQCALYIIATKIYNAGYRKQSEGEWIVEEHPLLHDKKISCSCCGYSERKGPAWNTSWGMSKFCPNCGAKMKGANNE